MENTTLDSCKLFNLPRIQNRAGNITPVSNLEEIPFEVKRIFYIYDIPGGEDRGAHSHKNCHQFIVAVSGSFEVHLNDGKKGKSVLLNRPYNGLHIPPGIWAAEKGFSGGAVCLVLTSHEYDENDYIRCFKDFFKYKLSMD